MVTVQVTRSTLPHIFFPHLGRTGNSVSATATAEAFNPSNSGNVGNGPTGTITPVLPRCVNLGSCPTATPSVRLRTAPPFGAGRCNPLVNKPDGSIAHPASR